jgi:uncharacterized protein
MPLSPISIRYPIRPHRRSLATNAVVDLFGLVPAEPPLVVAKEVTLDVRAGDVVLFTGPSGSGKSSLLRAAGGQLEAIDAMALELPDVALVDSLPGPFESRLELLAACGLSEARLLLRRPAELSDGQRYRFRVALAFSGVWGQESRVTAESPLASFLMADEFCAMLDRTLARVVAFNLRKLCTRTGVGALLATTHDDLIDDLQPDVLVRCHGDGAIEVERRPVKKNGSVLRTRFGFQRAPSPIGRISLGGITVATPSPSSAASCYSGTKAKPSAFVSLPRRQQVLRSDRASLACIARDPANISPR